MVDNSIVGKSFHITGDGSGILSFKDSGSTNWEQGNTILLELASDVSELTIEYFNEKTWPSAVSIDWEKSYNINEIQDVLYGNIITNLFRNNIMNPQYDSINDNQFISFQDSILDNFVSSYRGWINNAPHQGFMAPISENHNFLWYTNQFFVNWVGNLLLVGDKKDIFQNNIITAPLFPSEINPESNDIVVTWDNNNKFMTVISCTGLGATYNFDFIFDSECEDCQENRGNIYISIDLELPNGLTIPSGITPMILLSGIGLYGNSVKKQLSICSGNIVCGGIISFELLFNNIDFGVITTIPLTLSTNINNLNISNPNDIFTITNGYYYCMTNTKSGAIKKYHPLMNFNISPRTPIELLNTNIYNEPFRSDRLIVDSNKDIDLLLQPIYDNTLNLIINDKITKVKMVNSMIAYNPSDKMFSIPQNSGINDNNTYSNIYPNRMELILRSEKQMEVDFYNIAIGGEVVSGSYIFYFRYVDADGNVTDIQAHTLKIDAIYLNEDNYYNNEGVNTGEKTNCKIPIKLTNIDHSFSHIEVSFTISTGELNAEKSYFKIKEHIPITLSDYVNFEYNGIEELVEIEFSEIIKSFNHHKCVHTLEQSKNILNLGNIELDDISMYEDIQRIATKFLRIEEGLTDDFYSYAYKSSRYTYHSLGYWRGETYQGGLYLTKTKGGSSPIILPRGIDNIKGDAVYSDNNSIDDFMGAFGENPYGIYRTKLNNDLQGSNIGDNNLYVKFVYLNLYGIGDFLDEINLKYPGMFKGYTIARTNRLKDIVIQGYSSQVFKMPFGPGYKEEYNPGNDGNENPISTGTYSNNDTQKNFFDIDDSEFDSNLDENSSKDGHLLMAPMNAVQIFKQKQYTEDFTNKDYVPHLNGNSEPYLYISTKGLKGDIDDAFAFISGELNVDAEHLSAEFSGTKKYYHVSSNVTRFGNSGSSHYYNDININSIKDDDDNSILLWLRSKGIINNNNMVISEIGHSHYIPENSITGTNNFFSTKLDQTSLNFGTCAYIGVKESNSKVSSILKSFSNKGLSNGELFGLFTNVYNNKGPLPRENWIEIYRDIKNAGVFFPVTETKPINNKNLGQIFGGDCYLGISNVRVIQHNGVEDSFSSYSNIWDYVGDIDGKDFMNDKLDLDVDPATLTWFTDDIYTMMQRARLIAKGLWVTMINESNHNTMLRSSQLKDVTEKAIFGKDRTWLVSGKWNDRRDTSIHSGNDYIRKEYYSRQLETKNYNRGYSDNNGPISLFVVTDYEKILRNYYTRVEASLINTKNILKNNYREFYGIDYKDYDTKYGSIQKLIESNNFLYVFSERAISIVPLMEKIMTSEESGGVFTSQKGILGSTLNVISNNYGTLHPNSVLVTSTGIYSYDHNNICITLTSGNSVNDISSYKIDKFLYEFNKYFDSLEPGYEINIKTSYDNISGDVMFTFFILNSKLEYDSCGTKLPDDYIINNNIPVNIDCCDSENADIIGTIDCNPALNNGKCDYPQSHRKETIDRAISIYFNERSKKWISRVSFNPLFMFNLGKDVYSFNMLDNMNRIYMHESDNVNYCYYYDSQHTFSFEFLINKDPSVQKILDNFNIISNNRIPMYISYDLSKKQYIHSLEEYDLDFRQPILTRRKEIMIIGIPDNYDYYINVINRDNQDLIGYIFNKDGIDYRIDSVHLDTSLNGTFYESLYKLVISYNDGSGWNVLDNSSEFYKNPFSVILKIDKINISKSNADYVEDILYIQVSQMTIKNLEDNSIIRKRTNKEIRDKVFRIKIEYDGINHTYIHAVISKLRMSLN